MDIELYRPKLLRFWSNSRAFTFIGHLKNKEYHLSFSRFTGIKTLTRLHRMKEFNLFLEKTITQGDFELVLVNREHIIVLKAGTNLIVPGHYRLRIIGDHASGNLIIKSII